MARLIGETLPAINRGSILEFFSGDVSLKGCWPLNGNAMDWSGNGNHGTLSGNPSGTPSEADGRFHMGYRNDGGVRGSGSGSGQYISLPSGASLKNLTTATILCWYFPIANPSTQNGGIYYESTSNAGFTRFGLFHTTTGNLLAVFRDSEISTGFTITETTPNWLGRWQFLAFTLNSANVLISLYRNGVVIGTEGTPKNGSTNSTPTDIAMGAFVNASAGQVYEINGVIDETAIFNRELTPAEISQYYAWATSAPKMFYFYSTQDYVAGPAKAVFLHHYRQQGVS